MAWHSTWGDSSRRRGFFVDRGGLFPPGVKLVLIVTVGVFILENLWAGLILAAGSLSVVGLLHLEVWRLVTYMFLHGSTDHILINMFIFWMLGIALERQLGTRQFLALYFVAGIVGGLCETGFNAVMFTLYGHEGFLTMPAVGASAGVMGILVAFATLNPREKFLVFFLLPVEAWLVALVYGLFETWPMFKDIVYGPSPLRDDNVAHAAHFGGMVLGFVWIKWGWRLGRLWTRRPVRIVRRPAIDRTPENEAELDRILRKIHNEGLHSLTLRERLFLQDVSRRRPDDR